MKNDADVEEQVPCVAWVANNTVDMTAEQLHVYLCISHGSVSTEYGVGSIINNILFGTDGTTGYI